MADGMAISPVITIELFHCVQMYSKLSRTGLGDDATGPAVASQ